MGGRNVLYFSLGRENVFPEGDGILRCTVKWMYELEQLPSLNKFTEIFVEWIEFTTIVSLYLGKTITLELTRKPFDNIISN